MDAGPVTNNLQFWRRFLNDNDDANVDVAYPREFIFEKLLLLISQ